MTDTKRDDIGWCVVEMLGHRRTGAYVTEQEIAGSGFLRLEIPATPGHGAVTQLVSPASIYCLTPTSQDIATKAAELGRPAPVSRWELANLEPKPLTDHSYDDEDDRADDEGPF